MILLKILLLSILFCPSSVFSDAPENWQLGFQDPATPIMEGIINLHHDLMFFLCVILTFVAWMLFRTLWYFEQKQNSLPSSLAHGTLIEMIWTITPAFILLVIAVPSLGVKCDAIPGRLNQTSLFVKREGIYYGQCSEICGINHGFMPIVVEAVSLPNYVSWISNKLSE